MKRTTKRLSNLIVTIMITALLLTGAVPSFAWAALTSDDAAEDQSGSVVLPAINIDTSDAPKINGKYAIVMDVDTGTVLYEKKPDKVIEPASLTKILNCLVVLETLDLDEVVTVPENVETEGSCIWLEPGEKITVEELLYGMMLESGNDAAQVLGLTAGDGSLARFSDMMDTRAKECGATHTDYENPNGLNEDRDHLNYTTARDLALITREAMKKPMFREVVGSAKHTIPKTNKSEKRKLVNSNVCLWLKSQKTKVNGKEVPFKYEGCNGVKTGFTSDAGYCFVGSAERNGSEFLTVVLNAEDSESRFNDSIRLWDYVFSKYETYKVLKAETPAGVNRVWGGEKRTVEVGTQRDLGVTIEKGTAEEQEFTTEFRLDQPRVDAPIDRGQKMGQALVFNNKGRLVGEEDLYALAAVAEGGPLSHIGIADEDVPMAVGILIGVIVLIVLILLIRRNRRRRDMLRKKQAMKGELKNMRTAGVGMTATELTDLTGREEIVPIPRGPARVSNEELNAWTSTAQMDDANRTRGRFGGRAPVNPYAGGGAWGARREPYLDEKPGPGRNADPREALKLNITPRTPFVTGAQNDAGASGGAGTQNNTGVPGGAGAPAAGKEQSRRNRPMTDEELFAMLESTEVYDANQPRRHGKLTEEENRELMRRTRRPRSK